MFGAWRRNLGNFNLEMQNFISLDFHPTVLLRILLLFLISLLCRLQNTSILPCLPATTPSFLLILSSLSPSLSSLSLITKFLFILFVEELVSFFFFSFSVFVEQNLLGFSMSFHISSLELLSSIFSVNYQGLSINKDIVFSPVPTISLKNRF